MSHRLYAEGSSAGDQANRMDANAENEYDHSDKNGLFMGFLFPLAIH